MHWAIVKPAGCLLASSDVEYCGGSDPVSACFNSPHCFMKPLQKHSCGGGRLATRQLLLDTDVDLDVTQQTGALREFSRRGSQM